MKHFIQMTAAVLVLGAPALAQQQDLNRFGEKGYVPETQVAQNHAPRSTPEDRYTGGKSNYPVRDHVQFSDYQCPPNYTGMFRGTSYCRNGKLLP